MNSSDPEVIVIGGGHAGLSISYHLGKNQIDHLVFEKGKIGDTWRNQRWDSFRFNTANKVSLLPGQKSTIFDSDGFLSAWEFVSILEDYAHTYNLPIMENCEVLAVEKTSSGYSVSVLNDGNLKNYRCKKIVVASGGQNRKFFAPFAINISPKILQLHASEYRNDSQLPEGAVLVVGSAQSGVQIAEDLADRNRTVFISTSMVSRAPRRYRGKDIVDWLIQTGFFDVLTKKVDQQIMLMKFPQISGVGPRGHTLSLQYLAGKGVNIIGRAVSAEDARISLQPDASVHVKYADASSKKIKETIDDFIEKFHLNAPANEMDPADDYDEEAKCASDITSLNLNEKNITSIIWSTGFSGDFSFLKVPVFSESGVLLHHDGISEIEGLYFLGLPWLRRRKSGIVHGILEDSEFIINKLLLPWDFSSEYKTGQPAPDHVA
jgi:putative flavoprotein involved in K+ transport